MSLENTRELVQLDIARQDAKKEPESIITTAYSWYHWGKAAKNLGQLALSATPSAAIKFGAQLTLQPIADKFSERTGYTRISMLVRISIACTDPLGSAISYGTKWATDACLRRYRINNRHFKAIIKVASQEASSKVVTVVKASETYKATSDCLSQKLEEKPMGLKIKTLQSAIDKQCEKFDNHAKVKVGVEKANQAVETLSIKAAALPGSQKVIKAKQQLTQAKTAINKKLENPVTNKLAEKARELDNSGATIIRNSRLKEIEVSRQSLETRLRHIQKDKHNNQQELQKWQKLKLDAEQLKDEAALAEANFKLAKYEKSLEYASRRETAVTTQLHAMEKNIAKNTKQLKNLRYKELNNKLLTLTARQRLLQNDLEKATTDDARESIQNKLKSLEEEIFDTALFCDSCLAGEGSDDVENPILAMMPALQKLREKNRVIVRVWLPKKDDRLTSQFTATRGARSGGPTQDDFTVGHVSLEMPNKGHYISWWPKDPCACGLAVVPGRFHTYEDDIRGEDGPPDRVFFLYTMDTATMTQAFLKFKEMAEANKVGWALLDNRILRNNKTDPSGQVIVKTSQEYADSDTDNGTSCTGLVKKLLVMGGLDRLASLPDSFKSRSGKFATLPDSVASFISRNIFSYPEGVAQWLESAELIENAAHSETRQIRRQDAARISRSSLLGESIKTGLTFFSNNKILKRNSKISESEPLIPFESLGDTFLALC